ncbi:chitobiase/beta-hexosaminidase C-terminal domain-containing protein [Niallia sp. Krafla_26]|uniref:chitobiase/beta-hexosaminidase C-terminal domain-containing protein n=1 Tax=Niallia sp. Krafla_26 TaxID=3064703 RepID=UPI003D17AA82
MSKRKWRKPINTILSVGLAVSIVVPTLSSPAQAATQTSDLLISEYIEGSSFNKAIELYNGTGSDIDLSNYTLELYSNGASTASQTLKLSNQLKNGDTYVLYHKDANDDIKSKGDFANSTVINFNGDDPIVLKKDGIVIDSIGQVGARVENLKDVTLIRNSNIVNGDSITDDAFDPTVEWTALPKDDSSNLGIHGTTTENPENPENPVEVISIEEARSKSIGETVTIKGIVTANLKNTVQVQDDTAGIAVRPASLEATVGDEVTLKGKLSDYNGLLQLDGAEIVEKTEDVGALAPKIVTGSQVAEENESQLVTAKDIQILSVDSGSTWANYTVTDGTTQFIVRDERNELGLKVGKSYDSISGIVQQFYENYQIIPRSQADIIEDATVVQPVVASAKAGNIAKGTEVSLTTNTPGATIYFTTDGSEPTKESKIYQEPIVIDEDTEIKAIAIKEGLKDSHIATYEYTVYDPEKGLQIHHLQGMSHQSSMNGEAVSDIKGIVTYEYKIGSGNYFHMQTPDELKDDNPKTSEGIVVYTGNRAANVEVGDLVSVDGTVDEYHIDGYYDTKRETDLPVTQINARDDRGGNVKVEATDQPLPEPIKIDGILPQDVIDNDGFAEFDPEEDAIDFWESLEGMLVETGNVKAVAPQEHGDLITVLEDRKTDTIHGGVLLTEENTNPDRIQFKLYDNYEAREFEVATGDKFTGPISGVVNYGFQNYKIYTDYENMKEKHVVGEAKPEKTELEFDKQKVTIASYNLENFSNNKSETSEDKAQKLARAFAVDMQNPDIIGVTEVQDNNGQKPGDSQANESYERLIAEIEKISGVKYDYVNIDPENNSDGGAPNANIRVGFLYNPDRVKLTKGMPQGDATTAVGFEKGKLTHNPGRIDPTNEAFENSRKPLAAQFDFRGESVIVIVNHWNSKSGDTPLFGSTQPPVYGSEEQRIKIANVVNDFIEEIVAEDPGANIVSVGDFNDFQFSKALKIHEGEHMTNMINTVDKADRYTYLFQGNSQVLDHILVSNHLADTTKTDILHINADFTDMAGRASDHDPVLVQVDLKDKKHKKAKKVKRN